MSRICLYYRNPPAGDRWLPGDRFVRPWARRMLRGQRPSGLDKVLINLTHGLDRLGVPYQVNPPFKSLCSDDQIGVLGHGRYALEGYDRSIPIVAGIGLMTHPSEWSDLCRQYPVVRYLQHSHWTNEIYKRYFGDRCGIWPVGIDTGSWAPAGAREKQFDFLIYDKILWRRPDMVAHLLGPIRAELARRKLTFTDIQYGHYREQQYRQALARCRSMIFLCEHESQGIAYQECLASGVPILAWDQGRWLDPDRFAWGDTDVPATSVPYFDNRCGLRFRNMEEFPERLSEFLDQRDAMAPRDYVLENLALERCSRHFMQILSEARHKSEAAAMKPGEAR